MRRTLTIVIVGIILAANIGCSGSAFKQHTSNRTLGAIEVEAGRYNGSLVSFRGTARSVAVNRYGTNVLVAAGRDDLLYFRVQFPGRAPSIIRGDSVQVLGRVHQTDGVVGLGDRLTGTVQIDAIVLSNPHKSYSMVGSSELDLVHRWRAGEMVVLP